MTAIHKNIDEEHRMLWGWSFAMLERIAKLSLWIAVVAGVITALSAFIGGYVGLRLSGAIQKEADLR
jgi:putative Mn2+ efflux pump MntP